VAAKKNANLTRAMNLVAKGASGFRVIGLTRKLSPADEVMVFEALAARKPTPGEAPDLLAKAYARAGRFGDAVRAGKKGKYPGTLQEVAEAALDAGAFADAAAAFGAIRKPTAAQLVGLAVALQKSGEDPKDALARAEKANVAKKPVDWKSPTSCYEHVGVAIATAMIASVRGDATGAKRTLATARKTFEQVAQKSVRKECDDQLATPGDSTWWGSTIARHAGLLAFVLVLVFARPALAQRRGTFVQSDTLGMNVVSYNFDTGKTTGVGDVAALSEFVGLHYFVIDRLRVGMNFQFSEYLTDTQPGQSRFATFALLPQVGWHFWGPFFAAFVFTIAPWTKGGVGGDNHFDLGVQAVLGAGIPLGDRVALTLGVEVPYNFLVNRTLGVTPLIGVSFRLACAPCTQPPPSH